MHVDDIADRIAIARPDELDWIVKDMWADHANGLLSENDMEALDEAALARRQALQARPDKIAPRHVGQEPIRREVHHRSPHGRDEPSPGALTGNAPSSAGDG
jgi:hypothetical protein